MEVNAFIAGKENILKRKNANLAKCRPHIISQHDAVVFYYCMESGSKQSVGMILVSLGLRVGSDAFKMLETLGIG
jgi:hypothetical protein